ALGQAQINIKIKRPTKDVPTRWNSTFNMIESSLPCKLAFQQLDLEDKNFKTCPTKREWDKLKIAKQFLEPFKKATLVLSGTQYPTINHAYPLWHLYIPPPAPPAPTAQDASTSKKLDQDILAFHQHML
ncbi:hypothetical protein MJO28_005626, partial [Puccinia striiformis f. sp. tritici]